MQQDDSRQLAAMRRNLAALFQILPTLVQQAPPEVKSKMPLQVKMALAALPALGGLGPVIANSLSDNHLRQLRRYMLLMLSEGNDSDSHLTQTLPQLLQAPGVVDANDSTEIKKAASA